MTWGRALNKALRAAGVPSTFTKWRDLAAYRDQWRVLCGAKARGTVHTPPKHPRDIWAQVVDGPQPSNTAHPATAPRAHGANSHAPRLQPPSSTPLRSGGLPLWTFGRPPFARARAAGKNETEAGHARAKAEADIALCIPAEYRD